MPLLVSSLVTLVLAVASDSAIAAKSTPAEVADARFGAATAPLWSRMYADLAASNSPRDRALAAQPWLPVGWVHDAKLDIARGVMLRRAAAEAPTDRLVQYMWATAQPVRSGCNAQHPCPERAGAWASIEPDNAAAWRAVVGESLQAGHERSTDEALSRMAAASRHEDLWGESVSAWREVFARIPPGPAAGAPEDVELRVLGMAAAFASATALNGLPWTRACDRMRATGASETRFADCGRIGRLMLRHGNSFDVRHAGYSILAASANVQAEDKAVLRQVAWLREQHARQFANLEVDSRWLRPYFDDLAESRDETIAVEQSLQRAGLPIEPPAGWKSAYEK